MCVGQLRLLDHPLLSPDLIWPFEPSPSELPSYIARRFEDARAVYTTSKSYDDVMKAVYETVAPFPGVMRDVIAQTKTASGYQSYIEEISKNAKRPSGLIIFCELLYSDWFQMFTPNAPRSYKFIIGNLLLLKEIIVHSTEAALYAPWSFLLIERQDKGTEIIFDLPTAMIRSRSDLCDTKRLDEEVIKLEDIFKKLVESWL